MYSVGRIVSMVPFLCESFYVCDTWFLKYTSLVWLQGWLKHQVLCAPYDLHVVVMYYKDPVEALTEIFSNPANANNFKLHSCLSEAISTHNTGLWWNSLEVCDQFDCLINFLSQTLSWVFMQVNLNLVTILKLLC